jgi:hypothetical protein
MTNNLIEISKQIITNIENIDDIVDSYFEPIKDLTETGTDIFSPIKAIHSLYTLNKKRKFKNFLKGYANSLNENDSKIFEDTVRLKEYLKNERNYNFINDTIENAINAKSIYGSIILGYYTGKILSNEIRVGYKEIIFIEGIKELNDFELSCFIRIYSKADLSKKIIYLAQLKLNTLYYNLTIEKMIGLNFLTKDGTIYLGSNDDEEEKRTSTFISNEIAEDLFFLIKEIGIYDSLLTYEL